MEFASRRIHNKTAGASMHTVSRKDLDSVELEAVRASNSPTTVVTANGEVQTKEEATVYVRELDLFVTLMFLEDTPAVLSLGKLCDDHGFYYQWTSGPVVRNHISSKMAGRSIAIRRTTYHSLSLVYRQALEAHLLLLLQHLHRRKPCLLRSIPHQQEVRM